MELLVNQLGDRNRAIVLTAMDILEEAIHDKVTLKFICALNWKLTFVLCDADVSRVADRPSSDVDASGRSRPLAARYVPLAPVRIQVPHGGELVEE